MCSQIRMSVAASIVVAMQLFFAASANADLTTGLALYCDMEDTNSINVDKVVPNVHGDPLLTGSVGGNVTQVLDATRGNVLRFNTRSTNNFVNYGDNLDPGATSYTVAMWMKRYDDTSVEFPASKGNNSTGTEAWSFGLRNAGHASGPGLSVRANYEAGNDAARLNTATEAGLADAGRVLAGEWYHIAMVIDQETGHLYGYLNGVGSGEDGNNSLWTGSVVTFPNNGTADFDTAVALYLGVTSSATTRSSPFRGDVDDFAIWTRALSAAEIQTLYTVTADGTRIVDVPEPGVLVLLTGIGLFGLMSRRGRKL